METKKGKEVKAPGDVAAELNELTAHNAKIAELKKKHKVDDVFTLVVGDATAYLRKPNRKDIAASRAVAQGDYIQTNEMLLENCWLEGDDRIKNDDDYFLHAIPFLEGLIEAKTVELKKN